jgi:hypothetical protein
MLGNQRTVEVALTMTRTRTQAALTRLVELAANIHGELEMVEQLLTEQPAHRSVLAARKRSLEESRDALHGTLRQFDPALDPITIGKSDRWLARHGRAGSSAAVRAYVRSLQCEEMAVELGQTAV